MINRGCDVELIDRRDWTAPFEATQEGRANVAKTLLDNDASIRAIDQLGNTAEDIALSSNNEGEIVDILRSKYADVAKLATITTEESTNKAETSTNNNSATADDFSSVNSLSQFSHPGCAALHRLQYGNNTCESCGGSFRSCSGTYGYRDNNGVGIWRAGDCGPDLNHSSKSPNSRWRSRRCQHYFNASSASDNANTSASANSRNSAVWSNNTPIGDSSRAKTRNHTVSRNGRCQLS